MQIRFAVLMIFALTACVPRLIPAPDPTQIKLPMPSPVEIQPIYTPAQGDIVQMPPINTTSSPALESLIEMARKDLGQQFSIPTTDITLVEAQEVIWPDSSLGCPNPSVMYLQVLTPGYLIRFRALDQEFEFHADKANTVIYCPNPSPPLPGGVQSE